MKRIQVLGSFLAVAVLIGGVFTFGPSLSGQRAQVGGFDFTLGENGTSPHNVVQGYPLLFGINGSIISGSTATNIYLKATNVPAGTTVTFPDTAGSCCQDPSLGYYTYGGGIASQAIQVQTSAQTPIGQQSVTITANGGGVTHTYTFSFNVTPMPAPLSKSALPADVALPSSLVTQWQNDMIQYGKQYCNASDIASLGTYDGSVQYYDGTRVFYQIADYTKDPFWNTCAKYVAQMYGPAVITANGTQGYRVFPHGLYEDFLRTGDTTSKQAELVLASTGLGNRSTAQYYIIPSPVSRETAYSLNAMMVAEKLGASYTTQITRAANVALGHIDQWFVTKNAPYIQPFMVGLTSEALIDYYQKTGDPRVPPALKTAADTMWNTLWVPSALAFQYANKDDQVEQINTGPAPDLNMLIAPLYAWLYQQTGDVSYRDKADQIFTGSLNNPYYGSTNLGKQFSQHYRWAFAYMKWRSASGTLPPPPSYTPPSTTPPPTTTPPPPTTSNQLPKGNFDLLATDGYTLRGWSYDPDTSSQSTAVKIYINGPQGQGTLLPTPTIVSRPDVNTAFGITGDHGFELAVPTTYRDGVAHTYYVYAVDTSDSTITTQIGGSPATLTVVGSVVPPPVTNPNDTTPPTISNVFSTVTSSSVTITWTTNEASDSQAKYGLTTSYGSVSALNTTPTNNHTVKLSGLKRSTTYHFQVLSKDANGNIGKSADTTFTTLVKPGKVKNLSAVGI